MVIKVHINLLIFLIINLSWFLFFIMEFIIYESKKNAKRKKWKNGRKITVDYEDNLHTVHSSRKNLLMKFLIFINVLFVVVMIIL